MVAAQAISSAERERLVAAVNARRAMANEGHNVPTGQGVNVTALTAFAAHQNTTNLTAAYDEYLEEYYDFLLDDDL